MNRFRFPRGLALLCAGVMLVSLAGCSPAADPANTQPESALSEESQPAAPDPVSVSFVSVGDNLIHSSIYNQANDRAGGGNNYDFSAAYANVADRIAQADVATINQETVMDGIDPPSSYPLFNSPQTLGDQMIALGFDVFNLANNHMLDMGSDGLDATLQYWDSKTEVVHTGAYRNPEEFYQVESNTVNGLKIGYVGATSYTNGLSLPEGSQLTYILTSEEDLLKAKIEAARKVCDVVVVNVHWGNEYATEPTQEQRDLAQKMLNWGADVILGHHPHVLQTMEYLPKYDGEQGLVIYSLGNFISAQDQGMRMIGGMLNYTLTKHYDTDTVTVDNVSFEPVITHYDSGYKNIRLYLYSQYSNDLALAHGVRSNTSSFSMEYIDQVVSAVIPAEFWTPAASEQAAA